MALPEIQVQRASGGIEAPYIDHASGTWTCCTCHTRVHVYIHPGDHPLGKLSCDCPHKPCSTCTSSGQVKPFLPIEEPAMVPCGEIGDDGGPLLPGGSSPTHEKGIPFGIVCPACGLSWRAREFGKRFSKTLRKTPSLSLSQAMRRAPVEHKLRRSRSSVCLVNHKRIVTPPGEGLGKQADYVAVRFSGFVCLCGEKMGLAEAFCFQIVGADQEDERCKEFRSLWEAKSEVDRVGWSTTEELRGKGHGEEVLRLAGGKVEHPNPLKSAPVVDKMARDSWEEKCKAKGWV